MVSWDPFLVVALGASGDRWSVDRSFWDEWLFLGLSGTISASGAFGGEVRLKPDAVEEVHRPGEAREEEEIQEDPAKC